GEIRDGRDGAARRNLPSADRPAEARVESEDRRGAQGVRAAEGRVRLSVPMTLRDEVLQLVDAGASADRESARATFEKLRAALSAGDVRAAEPEKLSPLGWRVNAWVKQGILLGFKFGET